MQVKTAILYPFKKGRFKNTLVFPSMLTAGFILLVAVTIGIFIVVMGSTIFSSPSKASSQMIYAMIGVHSFLAISSMVVFAPIMGYLWALTGKWMQSGYDCEPPPWQGNMKRYAIEGFKLYVVGTVMIIPFYINLMLLGLLTPFLVTPYLLSAKERSIGAYFKCFGEAMGLAKANYLRLLGATYMTIPLYFLYMIMMIGMEITVVGILFVYTVMVMMMMAINNLFVQQLGIPPVINSAQNDLFPSGPQRGPQSGPSKEAQEDQDTENHFTFPSVDGDADGEGGGSQPAAYQEPETSLEFDEPQEMVMIPETEFSNLSALFQPRRVGTANAPAPRPSNDDFVDLDRIQVKGANASLGADAEADGAEASMSGSDLPQEAAFNSAQAEGQAVMVSSGSQEKAEAGEKPDNGLSTLMNNPWM